MTDAEKWAPVTVDSYLQDQNHPAFMIRPNGKRQRAPSLANLPRTGDCHGARPPCFQITIDCPSGSDDCAEGQPDRTDKGDTIPDYRDGADYVRIITRDEPGGSPQAFSGTGPYGKSLRTLIQYWYFYRYDEWTRPVLGGRLVQRHEGDWEAVTIGFSAKAPLFVGYSAHCGGSWVPWNKAELADTGPPRVHPLVAVAEGSHANYTRTQDRRAPDWAGCQGVPAGDDHRAQLRRQHPRRDQLRLGLAPRPDHLRQQPEAADDLPRQLGRQRLHRADQRARPAPERRGQGPAQPAPAAPLVRPGGPDLLLEALARAGAVYAVSRRSVTLSR